MTRKFKHEPEVQKVIHTLSRLYSAEKTLAGLSKLLSDGKEEARSNFHPNRLNGLLDGNDARAINEKTFRLILERIQSFDTDKIEDSDFISKLNAQLITLLSKGVPKTAAIDTIAIETSTPTGVVRALLSETQEDNIESRKSGTPDWSWQERAIRQTIAAVKNHHQKNLGLIVPTGGGKTTIAARVIYELLKDGTHEKCLWVAHRQFLITQARDAFSRVLIKENLIQEERRRYLDKITYAMKDHASQNALMFQQSHDLLIIDEAHRAGASTYQPLLNSAGFTGLFLTATPNRNDGKPIGMDQIAFQITPKKLFEAGCIIEPDLEVYEPWSGYSLFENDTTIAKFANDVLLNLSEKFNKTLICCKERSEVEEIYNALLLAKSRTSSSHLFDDDIVYIHGGILNGDERDTFFDDFEAKDSGVLVATSSLVSEGLDLPSIDSVYVTYESGSVVQLLQTAGRALRFSVGKTKATIIQVRSNDLQYFFNSSWLYQDISDRLRPRILTIEYSTKNELLSAIEELINPLNIIPERKNSILESVQEHQIGSSARLFLIGTYYHGRAKDFQTDAPWRPLWIDKTDEPAFVDCFNEISHCPKIEDPMSFGNRLASRFKAFSNQGLVNDFIHATNSAKEEILNKNWDIQNRGQSPQTGTTWLVNISVVFQSKRTILQEFLADCSNGPEVLTEFERLPKPFAIKLKNPLFLHHALLLDDQQFKWISSYLVALNERLATAENAQWKVVMDHNADQNECLIPLWALDQLHQLLSLENRGRLLTKTGIRNDEYF